MTDHAEFMAEFRKHLYNYCYDRVAQKAKWRNRDFDITFDAEVHEMYRKALDNLR